MNKKERGNVFGGIIAILLLSIASGCEKMFINGDLDGMWRLEQAQRGDTVQKIGNAYWNFQRHLIWLGFDGEEKLPHQQMEYHVGTFCHTSGCITMKGFRHNLYEEVESTPAELRRFCIFTDSTQFQVQKLEDERMILQSDSAILFFIKW